MTGQKIQVVGAGIAGLWQALTLARRGHAVTLVERDAGGFAHTASGMAGGMIAPFCEAEAAEVLVQQLGRRGLALWRELLPQCVTSRGTLVLAARRDRAELQRFARMTEGHKALGEADLAALEPELAGRFAGALFYEAEAHVDPVTVRAELLKVFQTLPGARWLVEEGRLDGVASGFDLCIDCRGYAARDHLPDLRGVRGEMILLHSPDIRLSRPLRFLHPRTPIYLVPRGAGRYMLGATMVESDDRRQVTVRGALELLSGAYGLHPGLAEAEILACRSAIRPAFADNLPKVVVRGPHILVNGFYRHGYLLAPVLAQMVADFIESPARAVRAAHGRLQVEQMV